MKRRTSDTVALGNVLYEITCRAGAIVDLCNAAVAETDAELRDSITGAAGALAGLIGQLADHAGHACGEPLNRTPAQWLHSPMIVAALDGLESAQ